MSEIVLTTLNAKYIHASFGLRYLMANLGELRPRAALVEFDINQRPLEMAEELLARRPRVIGIGVYIWNAAPAFELVTLLKELAPETTVVLGGPEVSFETEQQPIVQRADYVITGEGDQAFARLCRGLLKGDVPAQRIIRPPLAELGELELPYTFYSGEDIAHRIIYVEASRGCPFTCEFCLSSLDQSVRQFPLDKLLAELEALLERGVNRFKFVDRTFNLNVKVGQSILAFFLERYRPGLFLHFEMIPDRLPEGLRDLIRQFPPGALQFEVGIQTFNEAVAANISRRQNYAKLEENLRFLRSETGVHVHADLIVGLPGEDLESFARGFDRLVAMNPQEIQVGILKRLRGTPIVRHDQACRMRYNPAPPYDLLQNDLLPFPVMQRLRRFARFWDLIGNSGNFVETTPWLWSRHRSPFAGFMDFCDWLYARVRRTHGIALSRLVELLFHYLSEELQGDPQRVATALWRDYQRGGRTDLPSCLRPHVDSARGPGPHAQPGKSHALKRQARHLVTHHG